ncbi:MAG: type I DNA topoisomerase [Christensenellales bacterium]|jgi:DNA topoisomerase-1
MKTLIIVESPTKAKTIQKYLGPDYVVMASKGHVCDLPEKTLGIDIENRFQPQYIIPAEKQAVIKSLKSSVEKFKKVYLATDPDREGEAISWHLKNVLEIDAEAPRIEFHEISKKTVTAALQNPRPLDMNLVNSQQARRVLDRLVGYKISPILSKKIKHGSSAGRVQSAALEMIVTREREIRDFKPEEYWNIAAILAKHVDAAAKQTMSAALYELDGKKFKPANKEQSDGVLKIARGGVFKVESVKRGRAQVSPAPPFTTSTLTQDAAQKLSLAADQTMRLAQQLYEGVDVEGEGLTALITYIRTDSVRVSPDFAFKTLEYIGERFGREYAPKKPNFYKSKGDAQDAHEAIRPISLNLTPDSLKGKIKRDLLRLYKLIYDRYVASQMTPAAYDTLTVSISAENAVYPGRKLGFRLKGKTVAFKGFTVLYEKAEAKEEGEDESATIPNLAEGETLRLVDLKSEQKFTKPPARYTDGTIIKAMEDSGIGRPSTYSTIISVLLKREYIVREGKSIQPTELGESVCDYMLKFFPEIMNLTFTARMEGALDKIEEGEGEWQALIESFYPGLLKRVMAAYKSAPAKQASEVSGEVCEKCGAQMVIKEGRFGKFLACPNYPQCKNTKPLNQPEGTCPACGHDLYKRVSKSGKPFYACSNYPACEYKAWHIPKKREEKPAEESEAKAQKPI